MMTQKAAKTSPSKRAEDLWERLAGELCICQRADVSHWCESCQQKIGLILDALDRSLSPSQEPENSDVRMNVSAEAKIGTPESAERTSMKEAGPPPEEPT